MGVYVYGSGTFGERANIPCYGVILANGTDGHAFIFDKFLLEGTVSSVYETGDKLTCTRAMSPSPAATQIFFEGRVATGIWKPMCGPMCTHNSIPFLQGLTYLPCVPNGAPTFQSA